MPIYEYSCDCNWTTEVIAPMKDYNKPVVCVCGKNMQRIISLPNTDMINNVRFSNSMGVNPRQIPEMERKYPNSRYTPDGKLIVNSRKDKLHKMNIEESDSCIHGSGFQSIQQRP